MLDFLAFLFVFFFDSENAATFPYAVAFQCFSSVRCCSGFPLGNLLEDLVYYVFTFLDMTDLTSIFSVCRAFHRPAADSVTYIFQSIFGDLPMGLQKRTIYRMLAKAHSVNPRNQLDLFLWAASRGYIDYIARAVEENQLTDVKGGINCTREKDGYTAFLIASEHGALDVVQFLLRSGTFIFRTLAVSFCLLQKCRSCSRHRYMLMYAWCSVFVYIHAYTHVCVCSKRMRCYAWPQQQGADVNKLSKTSKHAIHVAAEKGHLPVLKYLIEVTSLRCEMGSSPQLCATPINRAASLGSLFC